MSVSFQSKDSGTLEVCLSVQELTVTLADNQIVSTSASTATINVGEPIKQVRSCTFFDDSAGTSAPVTAANRTISGNTVTLTLSAPLAAADAIFFTYVIDETTPSA